MMRAKVPSASFPEQTPYAAADAAFAAAQAYLSSREAQQMSESDLEREAAPTGSGLDAQAHAGTPRATRQSGGGRRSGRGNRRSRCH